MIKWRGKKERRRRWNSYTVSFHILCLSVSEFYLITYYQQLSVALKLMNACPGHCLFWNRRKLIVFWDIAFKLMPLLWLNQGSANFLYVFCLASCSKSRKEKKMSASQWCYSLIQPHVFPSRLQLCVEMYWLFLFCFFFFTTKYDHAPFTHAVCWPQTFTICGTIFSSVEMCLWYECLEIKEMFGEDLFMQNECLDNEQTIHRYFLGMLGIDYTEGIFCWCLLVIFFFFFFFHVGGILCTAVFTFFLFAPA